MTIRTSSEKETFDAGRNFADKLKGGEVIAMDGELGAGKTVFVKGMAEAFKIKKTVTSPTFALMNEYRGEKLHLCHFDVYRLKNSREFFEAGLADFLSQKDCVCVIEWADKIADILPKDTIKIKIVPQIGGNREIEII